MAKITKHADFLEDLRKQITKTSEAGKVTGKPGADTHYTSVSESTETVNKNEQGKPEHNPQEVKQEASKDKSDPTKGHKKAEEAEVEKEAKAAPQLPDTGKAPAPVEATNKTEQKKTAEESDTTIAELGKRILETIKAAQAEELEKEAKAGKVTGKPGADTHYTSTSEKTETVNKNEQGKPESNPQEVKQEASKDKSDPTKKHAEQEDLDKIASFELGRQFCRSFIQTKTAANLTKEAGRRDFETLITRAAEELNYNKQAQVKKAEDDSAVIEKQAEEAGALAFQALYKQAQEEYQAEQLKLAFEQRLATLIQEREAFEKEANEAKRALAEKEASLQKKAEEEKRAGEFAQWGNYIVNEVMSRIRNEADK